MYRLLSISICFLALLSCKYHKKDEEKNEDINKATSVTQTEEKVISKVKIAEVSNWDFRGIKMTNTNEVFQNDEAHVMAVIDHKETYTFTAINSVKLAYTGGRYRISLIVKSNKKDSNLGIRVQEVYPNRFDVVFDLEKEEVRGVFNEGDFVDSEEASIEPIGGGWYKCTIDAEIYASYFRLVFGPTNVPKGQTGSWEAESLNDKNREILILPNSVIIEELEN